MPVMTKKRVGGRPHTTTSRMSSLRVRPDDHALPCCLLVRSVSYGSDVSSHNTRSIHADRNDTAPLGVLLGVGSGPGTSAAYASPSSSSPVAAHADVRSEATSAPASAAGSSVGEDRANSLAGKYDRESEGSPLLYVLFGVVLVSGIVINIVRFRRYKRQKQAKSDE